MRSNPESSFWTSQICVIISTCARVKTHSAHGELVSFQMMEEGIGIKEDSVKSKDKGQDIQDVAIGETSQGVVVADEDDGLVEIKLDQKMFEAKMFEKTKLKVFKVVAES